MNHTKINFNFRMNVARSDFHQTIMSSLNRVLQGTELPTLTALALAAEAVGTVYREMAEAHRNDPDCPCGWRPDPETDIEIMQRAMERVTYVAAKPDLVSMQPAGKA